MRNYLDYEIIDFGHGQKLERFGKYTVIRPEVLAVNKPKLSFKDWEGFAHGKYLSGNKNVGKWLSPNKLPENWICEYNSPTTKWSVELKPGKFKHVGVFPEQEKHWIFIENHVDKGSRFLNLFAYTGASSLAAAKRGADVFHVDSSKSIINQAAHNAKISKVDTIRWVVDDALKFAERQNRKNSKFDFIIMDPPVFGQGKKGQRWKLEDLLPQLVTTAASLLVTNGYLILNTYSPVISLGDMERLMKKNQLQCIEKGWLHVTTLDNRKLELSKYTISQSRK